MRILVTGAGSLIGTAAVRTLRAQGHELHILPHSFLYDPPRLGEALAAAQPEAALHLAWCAGPGVVQDEMGNSRALAASRALIRALAETGCRRFVTSGSGVEAIPDTAVGRSPYAAAKRALHAELACVPRTQMSTLCAHVFGVLGPGEAPTRAVPRIVRALLTRTPLDVSSCTQLRDVLHVDDVASALALLLGSETAGTIDICSGNAQPLRALFTEIENASGITGMLHYGAAALPPEHLYDASGNSSALRALGWAPSHTMESAVADTIAWWRDRL